MGGGGFETLLNSTNKQTNIKNKFKKKIYYFLTNAFLELSFFELPIIFTFFYKIR